MKNIGIDLGTANTLIYEEGKGIVFNEPSVVAVDTDTGEVYAAGNEAKAMLGRTPGNIRALRPLKEGVIADYSATQAMLKYFIKKVVGGFSFSKPTLLVSIPSGVTEVEKRAVEEAGLQAGAKCVYLIEEPMAAAIGAGLPVELPTGSMIVDIGGGTSEVAILSLGGIVTSISERKAGDELDGAIINYFKKEFNILIGERTAEAIKIELGSAIPFEDDSEEPAVYKGQDLLTGLPSTISVKAENVREALREPIYEIVETIKQTLEKTPPELAADVMEHGIVLSGGGALIRGLDELITQETGIKCSVAQDPLFCVANGTGKVLSDEKFVRLMKRTTRR